MAPYLERERPEVWECGGSQEFTLGHVHNLGSRHSEWDMRMTGVCWGQAQLMHIIFETPSLCLNLKGSFFPKCLILLCLIYLNNGIVHSVSGRLVLRIKSSIIMG